ncbi:Hsp20/alpha crystallin family protein [Candidatus Poribacteria bacterium]|nr:Hsp20/alpha crystallin family protein [Candidatus Poribacteria bacterium]
MRSNPSRLIEEFFEMQKELDRLFDAFIQPSQNLTAETALWRPPMDIYETVESFVIKMEVAGLKPDEDVHIQLNQNILTIRGYRQERTALKKEHYHQAELNYGPFERSIVLPNVLAEEVEPKASYENGFLEVHIPKAKCNHPKEIIVQVKEEPETTPSVNPA